ncbi:leucine-rich repeat transmembrane neuronal protein 4-like isoform X2 [Nylanderia fulva]|uniref:leucine-rich repeat transmembrane neuronal protein 4-like isoform X2 n=1 Tax=Nylanderia fulva TaxID=613905 RepID=UPI0010FBBBA4|nr:leucine-rich repeat transmembrane neuronal protein 4-like isoform X2 [Nylanderia fulva]
MLKNMRIFLFNGFLLLGYAVASLSSIYLDSSESAETMDHCHYIISNSLLEARCPNFQLSKIPLDLNPDIQVLNVTGHLLLRLTNDSLHPYKELVAISLHYLVLHKIDNAVFANQPYLEVLDLRYNIINYLPKSLFQLPYLHTLYLGHNLLYDSVFNVTSPLRLLELSKNLLTVIPNIGIQPTLFHLDVSYNKITSISTEDLAPFCSLKELDLTGNRIKFNASNCDCQAFNAWVRLRQIKMKSDLYKCTDPPAVLYKDCANVRFSDRTHKLFNECLAMKGRKMEIEKPRSFWISVVSCVSVFLFVVFVALFFVHKRYRSRYMKQEEQLTAVYDNTQLIKQQLDDDL